MNFRDLIFLWFKKKTFIIKPFDLQMSIQKQRESQSINYFFIINRKKTKTEQEILFIFLTSKPFR